MRGGCGGGKTRQRPSRAGYPERDGVHIDSGLRAAAPRRATAPRRASEPPAARHNHCAHPGLTPGLRASPAQSLASVLGGGYSRHGTRCCCWRCRGCCCYGSTPGSCWSCCSSCRRATDGTGQCRGDAAQTLLALPRSIPARTSTLWMTRGLDAWLACPTQAAILDSSAFGSISCASTARRAARSRLVARTTPARWRRRTPL